MNIRTKNDPITNSAANTPLLMCSFSPTFNQARPLTRRWTRQSAECQRRDGHHARVHQQLVERPSNQPHRGEARERDRRGADGSPWRGQRGPAIDDTQKRRRGQQQHVIPALRGDDRDEQHQQAELQIPRFRDPLSADEYAPGPAISATITVAIVSHATCGPKPVHLVHAAAADTFS